MNKNMRNQHCLLFNKDEAKIQRDSLACRTDLAAITCTSCFFLTLSVCYRIVEEFWFTLAFYIIAPVLLSEQACANTSSLELPQ